MKWIILFLILFVGSSTCCQSKKVIIDSVYSVFLNAVESRVFKEEFRVCDYACNEINIFDYNNAVSDRPLNLTVCNKKINQYNTTSLDHPTPSSIVIYRLDKGKNGEITIYFMRPYSGASIILTYEVGDDIKLIETRIGTF